ncbi:MAG TPA: hypothetical protein VE268_01910 [Herpetosiphonaceae bacterium]|nr:hypothetical protein [Herpetosiphonaceae bacterium]
MTRLRSMLPGRLLAWIVIACLVVAAFVVIRRSILIDHGCDWTGFGSCPSKDIRPDSSTS